MGERDENLEYVLLEHQRSNNFNHSLRSFQTQKGWKQKLGYGVFSILVLICMLTVTSVLLNKTGNRRDTNSLEASAKKFLPDIEIDVSTSNNSFTINSTHIESTTTTTTSATTTTKRISDVEIILNNEWQQTDGINIKAYLKVEGGNYFYQKMAAASLPRLTFSKEDRSGLYSQMFKVGLYTQKYPLDFNNEYYHKDGIGNQCRSTASIINDTISIKTFGGKKGPVVATYSLKDDGDLWITQDMIEEKITNTRIYKKIVA